LPHRPETTTIHVATDAARVGKLAGIAQVAIVFNCARIRGIEIDWQFDA